MTKTARTLELLRAGWVTPIDCALQGGCLSLSQRVGDLRRAGWWIDDNWTITDGGARIKAYRAVCRPADGAVYANRPHSGYTAP